jgi:hypothetical protein
MTSINIINPIDYPNWNRQVSKLEGATIFHTANWALVLAESYGYRPRYFTAIKMHRIIACIPVMQIDSVITGRRGVCLPFTDFCRPIGDENWIPELWNALVGKSQKEKWKHIELRGECTIVQSANMPPAYKEHSISLDTNESDLMKRLRQSTRRNITKAIRHKVIIHSSQNSKAIEDFYRLNCLTRKRHGLPPQPRSFYCKIKDHMFSSDMGFILTAVCNGTTVASALFFQFNGTVFYKYAASDILFQQTRANNLLVWRAIERSLAKGFKLFHFGLTAAGNSGLLQFKRGWGAVEKDLNFFRYIVKEQRFIKKRELLKTSYIFFKKMPMPLLRLSGEVMYRHVG